MPRDTRDTRYGITVDDFDFAPVEAVAPSATAKGAPAKGGAAGGWTLVDADPDGAKPLIVSATGFGDTGPPEFSDADMAVAIEASLAVDGDKEDSGESKEKGSKYPDVGSPGVKQEPQALNSSLPKGVQDLLYDARKSAIEKVQDLIPYAAGYSTSSAMNKIADIILQSDLDFDMEDAEAAEKIIDALQGIFPYSGVLGNLKVGDAVGVGAGTDDIEDDFSAIVMAYYLVGALS